jgi:hypothetical protein
VTPSSAQPRKLDAATEQQAIASAQWLIKLRGGLSHKYSQDYWRFSTKAELCGQVDTGERFVQGIKDALGKNGEVSIYFLPGPGKWNEELAAKLIANATQGDAADQVLREVAAACLERDELPPKPLADYAATCLRAPSGREKARQQPNSSKPQSHKTDYRDWILALTVDDVARHFNLTHTRNDATEEHCACSIVALAADLHESTVQNAWDDYKGVADQRTATNYVPQAMVSVPSDGVIRWRGRTMKTIPPSAHTHFLVQFPRVGSAEAVSRPSNRKAERAKRNRLRRKNRPR